MIQLYLNDVDKLSDYDKSGCCEALVSRSLEQKRIHTYDDNKRERWERGLAITQTQAECVRSLILLDVSNTYAYIFDHGRLDSYHVMKWMRVKDIFSPKLHALDSKLMALFNLAYSLYYYPPKPGEQADLVEFDRVFSSSLSPTDGSGASEMVNTMKNIA